MNKITTALALLCVAAAAPCPADRDSVPPLDHVFVIVMENHSYDQIIGNPKADFINRLAGKYNLATHYTAVAHPSLPNYLALVAGDYFGVHSDASPAWDGSPAEDHLIPPLSARTVADQLAAAGKSWKSYQEDLPASGAGGVNVSPGGAGGGLYAVKHNPFVYFASIRKNRSEMAHIVPETRLAADLRDGKAPNLAFIVPNQCHDMHGTGGPCAHDTDAQLITAGDKKIEALVGTITAWRDWHRGRNIIAITWDEDNYARPDNHVPAIFVTNHGPRGVRDATPYTHYSLLRTIEAGFGLEYLGHAADPGTKTMSPMVSSGGK